MKLTIPTLCGLTLVCGVLLALPILADEVQQQTREKTTTTTTTTNSSGTVSQFGPDMIAIKTSSTAAPVTYRSTTTTAYVDESGKPVASTTIKSGVPVTVYYSKNGDQMVATKVVVKRTTATNPPAEEEEE